MSLHFQNLMLYTWLIFINIIFWIFEEVRDEGTGAFSRMNFFCVYINKTSLLDILKNLYRWLKTDIFELVENH